MNKVSQRLYFIDHGNRVSACITTNVESSDGVLTSYVAVDLTDEDYTKFEELIEKRKGSNVVLTEASHDLFAAYAEDAGNWSGTPLVGGNVGGSKEDAGNLTDLKKKGLLTTYEHDGDMWVEFTEAGKAYAAEHGVTIYGD